MLLIVTSAWLGVGLDLGSRTTSGLGTPGGMISLSAKVLPNWVVISVRGARLAAGA